MPLLAALAGPALAQQSDANGDPILHRGLNLGSWIGNAYREPVYERDVIQIKQAGFDFVRLPVGPDKMGLDLGADADAPAALDFTALDAALGLVASGGLAVVLDIHPGQAIMKQLEESDAAEDRFVQFWQAIAARYKDYPHSTLAYELLNEPHYYDKPDAYNRLVKKLLAAIRAQDRDRLVIVESPGVASGDPLDSLKALDLADDAHVAYDFHFYKPYIITHQGANSGFEGKQIPYIRELPYPASLAHPDTIKLAPEADKARAAAEIADYIAGGWSRVRLASYLNPVAQWAALHHVRVLCLEFGVLRTYIDPQSRYRWIKDARSILDQDHIGWALWDYDDLFRIVTMNGETSTDPVDKSVRFVHPESGSRTLEPEALEALGLAR